MKLGKYNITLGNIAAYIQGNARILIDKYGGEFIGLEDHIKEQIIFREKVANKTCLENKECKCGCPIPDMFFADKTCEDECYPVMMNKEDWERFKRNEDVAERPKHNLDISCITKDVDVLKGVSSFEVVIRNNGVELPIDYVQLSCNCLKTEIPDTLSKGDTVVKMTVDTSNRETNTSFVAYLFVKSGDVTYTFSTKINVK